MSASSLLGSAFTSESMFKPKYTNQGDDNPRLSRSLPPVDGATSTCALGEGSAAFVNQTIIPQRPTRHISTKTVQKNESPRGQNHAIHEPPVIHFASPARIP